MVEVQEQFADRRSALPPSATTMGHPSLQRLLVPMASAVGLSLLSLPLVLPQAQALPLVRAARWNAIAGPVPVAAYGRPG